MIARTALLLALLAVLIVAGVLVHSAYRGDMEQARARLSDGAHIIHTARGAVQFAEQGSGVALLSIHGAGGGYDQGLAIAADLVGGGYRVIAPSRFGYLDTPVPPDPSDAAQADVHAALLDALGIERAVVIGTSAGARSAIELALRHPHRVIALGLIVPATFAPTSPVRVEESRGSRLAFWLVSNGADFAWWSLTRIAPSLLVRFLGVPPALTATATEREKRRIASTLSGVQPLSQRFRGINLDSVAGLPPRPLQKIGAPTLIVTARDDLFNTLPAAEFAARSIPGAKLDVLETGGHLLVGREAEVRRTITDFIEAQSAFR